MRKTRFLAIGLLVLFSSSMVIAQRGSGAGASGGAAGTIGPRGSAGIGNGPNMSTGRDSERPMVTGKESPDSVLSHNTKLSANLQKLLPAGTSAQQACSGFRKLGQCVSALHVSQNLGIPFDSLKSSMIGGNNLGKAIQALDPKADAKAEAKKAQKQAKADLETASS